jgi:cysteine desulfurase
MHPIYLDHAASTFLRTEVREVMEPLLGAPANPSSLHRWGRRAHGVLEEARGVVAGVLEVEAREILFVRGGTEANNLAILGRAGAVREEGGSPHVVVSAIEHHAVLDTLQGVRSMGGRGTVLPVDAAGAPDPQALERALEDSPAVVSVMAVNNETGALPPLEEVAATCGAQGVIVHTDAVQAPGHIPLPPLARLADLISLSGHKTGGPVGTGILRVRRGVALTPLLHGGGQEGGLRPGTQDVAGAVGMAEALRLASLEQEETHRRLTALSAFLQERLAAGIPGLRVHGVEGRRSPHIVNVGIPGVDPDLLLPALDMEGIAASRGSACSSGASRPSHVLVATLGAAAMEGFAPLRLSLGRETRMEELVRAAETIILVACRLSPGAVGAI